MSNLRMNSQNTAQYYKEKMVGKRYRHFKGGIYIVTDIAVHSESAGLMVIYKIICLKCFNGTDKCRKEEDAVRRWNNRKPMQKIVERLEERKNRPPELEYRHLNFEEAIEIVKEVGGMND